MARKRFILCFFTIKLLLFSCVLADQCPYGWEQVDEACYRLLMKDPISWNSAVQQCQGLGGGLAVPGSQREQDAIWGMVKQENQALQEFWIGCQKGVGADDIWTCTEHDGTQSYFSVWADGEQEIKNGQSSDDIQCARMKDDDDGGWADKPCDGNKYYAICETSRDIEASTYGQSNDVTTYSPSGDRETTADVDVTTYGPSEDSKTSLDIGSPAYCAINDDRGRISSQCLTGHVIKELPIKGVIACGSACRDEPRCRSFNVRDANRSTSKTCQLNDKRREEAGKNEFDEEGNCYYFDI